MVHWNSRKRLLICFCVLVGLFAILLIAGSALSQEAMRTDFSRKELPPSLQYPFGTDWMGRNMFARTLTGLATSVRLGLVTASMSAVVALCLGAAAAMLGKAADTFVCWLIDLVMGVPHMLLLVLISFACGKGFWGVVIGIICTHWMGLARMMRAEILQLKQSGYVQVAQKLGTKPIRLVCTHLIPHLLPQFIVGLVLLFPHAILHEASITFLGFGLSSEQPAIGVILSESMRYLITGQWWLAVFPGVALVCVVLAFHFAGSALHQLFSPAQAHK